MQTYGWWTRTSSGWAMLNYFPFRLAVLQKCTFQYLVSSSGESGIAYPRYHHSLSLRATAASPCMDLRSTSSIYGGLLFQSSLYLTEYRSLQMLLMMFLWRGRQIPESLQMNWAWSFLVWPSGQVCLIDGLAYSLLLVGWNASQSHCCHHPLLARCQLDALWLWRRAFLYLWLLAEVLGWSDKQVRECKCEWSGNCLYCNRGLLGIVVWLKVDVWIWSIDDSVAVSPACVTMLVHTAQWKDGGNLESVDLPTDLYSERKLNRGMLNTIGSLRIRVESLEPNYELHILCALEFIWRCLSYNSWSGVQWSGNLFVVTVCGRH